MTHRIEFFKQKCDSKNWTFLTLTQRTVFLLKNELFFKYGSKNWIFLFSISQRIGVFQYDSLKITQRIVFHVSKSWIFFNMSQRIQLFFQIRRKELHPFLNTTQRIEPFFLWIRRKELNPFFFFEHDAKNWKLCLKRTRRIEPSRKIAQRLETSFFELDSKNRTLFFLNATQKLKIFVWKIIKTLNSFQKIMTQRIEFSQKMMQRVVFFFKKKKNLIRRMEPSWKYDFQTKTWLKELNPFWLGELIFLRLKEVNFSSNMARRIELFCLVLVKEWVLVWLKELNFFNMSQRFQPFFQIRKELHPFSFNTTQRIEPFSLNMTQRNEHLFLIYDAKNWNIWSRNMTQRIEPCVKKKNRLKEWNSL